MEQNTNKHHNGPGRAQMTKATIMRRRLVDLAGPGSRIDSIGGDPGKLDLVQAVLEGL